MIRFIQSGDLHLESVVSERLGEKATRELERLAFDQIIEAVISTKASLLFLCGDIFDNDHVKQSTLNYVMAGFARVPFCKIFISPGNHDYIGRNPVWLHKDWPKHVHIFSDYETVELPEEGLYIHGFGFTSRLATEGLLPLDLVLNKNRMNILVAHGDIALSSDYNPMSEKALTGFDYIALGHRHGFECSPNGSWAYAGSPLGRGFSECGEKGCIFGRIQEGKIHTSFFPFDLPGYYDLAVEVAVDDSVESLENKILDLGIRPENHYRIHLLGKQPLLFKIADFTQGWDGQIEFVDETKARVDYEAIAEEWTLAGLFTRKLLALQETNEIALEALDLGLDVLSEGEVR